MRQLGLFTIVSQASISERSLSIDHNSSSQPALEVSQFSEDSFIDLPDTDRRILGADSAMNKEGIVNLNDGVVPQNPLPVFPFWSDGGAVLKVSEWMFFFPLRFISLVEPRDAFGRRLPVQFHDVPHVGRLLEIRGFCAHEGGTLSGMNVANIAINIHGFVVADQRMHITIFNLGLRFKFHQQVHYLAAVCASVGNIASLHEVSFPADPIVVLVDQPGEAEKGYEPIVVAMNVADGDNPFDATSRVLRRLEVQRRNPTDEQYQNHENRPATFPHFDPEYHTQDCGLNDPCSVVGFALHFSSLLEEMTRLFSQLHNLFLPAVSQSVVKL